MLELPCRFWRQLVKQENHPLTLLPYAKGMASRISHRRWLLRDVPHIAALLVWAAFGFAILTYFVDWSTLQRWMMLTASRGNAAATTQADVSTGKKPYNGTILFVPPRGDFCSEWMFDNRNGEMWDKGQVNCSVTNSTDKAEGMSGLRMRAIGKAFKD
jgi:hypothetical protein